MKYGKIDIYNMFLFNLAIFGPLEYVNYVRYTVNNKENKRHLVFKKK
jgi:hypothetical protein